MPAPEIKSVIKPLSGRSLTSRTPLFLSALLTAIIATSPQTAWADQPPGAYLNSSQNSTLSQPQQQQSNIQNQPMPDQQTQNNQQMPNNQMSDWQQPSQPQMQPQAQSLMPQNQGQPGSFQGNATIGVTGTPGVPPSMGQYQPSNQQQPMQQPVQQPMQQQQPQAAAGGNVNNNSQYPTLNELNDKLDQTASQNTNGQQSQTGPGGGAAGMASSVIKTIGNIAAPMAYGRSGMGMGGMGMGGYGMPGYGGMGYGGLPMGMGGYGNGYGNGYGGMPMGMGGYNPFMSPSQQMMNSIINQGARLFSH